MSLQHDNTALSEPTNNYHDISKFCTNRICNEDVTLLIRAAVIAGISTLGSSSRTDRTRRDTSHTTAGVSADFG